MDNDKAHELIEDAKGDGMSNCCSAGVYMLGDNAICTDCKEWCEVVEEE